VATANAAKKGSIFMEILRVENLTKSYGKDNAKVLALGGITFSVQKGSFVAVVGASGSGKSTLLHLLGGVDRPSAGKVFIDGLDIFQMNESNLAVFRRRNLGLVYQFYNLVPTLTAEENILLPYLLDGRKPDAVLLRELLETIGLSDRSGHLPSELSGGQQQRVSIARALINSPAVILADEPTGNLDSKSSREVIDLLKLANKRYSQTLLLITHDEKIALQADRIITLNDGQIVRDEAVRP
jgi:putative ABC transport system ATP-binding protein